MLYYSIHWECLSTRGNFTQIRTTFLDEAGHTHTRVTLYEGWIGVCTRHIDRVLDAVRHHFPGHRVRAHLLLDQARKILPYFERRLDRQRLDVAPKPFYKLYTTACIHNVGRFFHRYKFAYYRPDDWRHRLYLDLCTQHDTYSFYYQWYAFVDPTTSSLLKAYRMVPERQDAPDWTLAAFDLESVPLEGNHVPMGHHPSDRIVMISLYKWNRRQRDAYVLYLLPDGIDPSLAFPSDAAATLEAFSTEAALLERFHRLLRGVHVLTGYNIHAFDLPCLFARLLRLDLKPWLARYRSSTAGPDVVVTYDRILTLDLYPYFKTFSGYDLPSFKLDDVARVKLAGEAKLPVKATGLWSYYRTRPLPRELFEDTEDVVRCYDALRPDTLSRPSEFGTFRTYLDYCRRDSELVVRLFEKEGVLSFLVARANFTALTALEALHVGNSRYLLELFQTYGTRLGYFINPAFLAPPDHHLPLLLGTGGGAQYQGALNFCHPERLYEDVAVMDFASMYPSTLLSSNLCYGTCTLLTRDAWLALPASVSCQLTALPYRQHSGLDFERPLVTGDRFAYPPFDPTRDDLALVLHTQAEGAFLPRLVDHFIRLRQSHQRQWKASGDVYHYNVQLGIKILINSLYGVMASKDSPLAYLPIAVIIVTLARYQLLGSFHYLRNAGYEVCYADTDSLMVHRWPTDHCEALNTFLGLPGVSLQFEQRMRRLLVLSKKRYVYESQQQHGLVTKGFQKKVNGLIAYMTRTILEAAWHALFEPEEEDQQHRSSRGWVVWVQTLQEAQYRCRDPKRYALYRKIKKLEQYVSTSCPAVKYLTKYPDRTDEHVEFTYSRTDGAASEASNGVMDVADCQQVNVEQLFMSQKKIFCLLLNVAFWHVADPVGQADRVLNTLTWKRFVHAELLHRCATRRALVLLVEPGVKYTFSINDHLTQERRAGRKRKVDLGF